MADAIIHKSGLAALSYS